MVSSALGQVDEGFKMQQDSATGDTIVNTSENVSIDNYEALMQKSAELDTI
jgi:hypothetical protein